MNYTLQIINNLEEPHNIATNNLKQKYRTSKILYLYKQGLSQTQIAHELNINQSTVCRDIQNLNKQLAIPINEKLVECANCTILFQTKIYLNPKFCSRECYTKSIIPRYEKYYFCIECKWIPKQDAILKPKDSIINYKDYRKYKSRKDQYCCPKCSLILRTKDSKRKVKHIE